MQTQAIEQTWNWSDFSWGEGDGFYAWPAGSYRMGENLDTRRVENGARACNKLETVWTYTGTINSVYDYAVNSFSTNTTTTINFYYNGSLASTSTRGSTAAATIKSFGRMRRQSDGITYPYAITNTASGSWLIYRLSADFTTVDYTAGSFAWRTTAPVLWKMPVVNIPNGILFGYWNILFEFTWLEGAATAKLTLPETVDIVAITQYQDSYKLYCNDYKWANADSFVAFWDWVSTSLQQVSDYKNSPVIAVANDWPYDYAVFWTTFVSDLYRMEWLIRRDIRNNIESSSGNSRILLEEMAVSDWIVYIKWRNKIDSSVCVYTYWRYYPGTASSLVPDLKTWIDKFGFTDSYMYIYTAGNVYRKSKEFSWNAAASFKIYSYPLRWNFGFYTKKSLEQVNISYRLASADDEIKIYVRKAGWPYATNSSGWTLLTTITGADDFATMGKRVDKTVISSKWIWDFNQLEWRVDATNAGTNSAILHQIFAVYIDNIKA